MKFTNEILIKIEAMGAEGYSFARIAGELNMLPDTLRDLSLKDKKLKDALDRSEFNKDQFYIAKLEADYLSGKKPTAGKELFLRLKKKYIDYKSL